MKARITGGLAAAALVGTALACPGAALAADPAGYPYQLDFTPSQLITTDDAVYAIGYDGVHTAYVAEVGGEAVAVGTDVRAVSGALIPSDPVIRVLVSDNDGEHFVDVELNGMDAAPTAVVPEEGIEVLASDSVDLFQVTNADSLDLRIPDYSPVVLDANASARTAAAAGPSGGRVWYVAGSRFLDEVESEATLWTFDEGPESIAAVPLGAAGDPDDFVLDLAVADSGVAYALTFRDNDDAPQSYGITVVQPGADAYVPLEYGAQDIALSPDGETLYLATSDSVLPLDSDRLADGEADALYDGVTVDAAVTALAVDADGNVFAGDEGDVVSSFAVPAAPVRLAGTPDSMSTTAFTVSWEDGLYEWERDDTVSYRYSVTDAEGGLVDVGVTRDQNLYVEDLAPGKTYTVRVAALNGLQAGPVASAEVTTYSRYLTAPSALSVQGSLTVGSTLGVATTGTWEAGTAVSYEWYGSNGEMGGQIGSGPTLTLTADHLGLSITAVATGTKAGAAGVTVSGRASGTVAKAPVVTPPAATPTTPAPAPTPTTPATPVLQQLKAAKPKITGPVKVGKTLSAEAGSWTKGTKLAYQWLANGKSIKGETGSKLKLTKALKGKKISVEVTGTKAGYQSVTKESAQTAKVQGPKPKRKR